MTARVIICLDGCGPDYLAGTEASGCSISIPDGSATCSSSPTGSTSVSVA